jgi:hypothetical protein
MFALVGVFDFVQFIIRLLVFIIRRVAGTRLLSLASLKKT